MNSPVDIARPAFRAAAWPACADRQHGGAFALTGRGREQGAGRVGRAVVHEDQL